MNDESDRELLEKAARAAGFSCWRSKHGYLNVTLPDGSSRSYCHDWPTFDSCTGEKLPEPALYDALQEIGWDPRHDSGQALELAVKLKQLVDCEWCCATALKSGNGTTVNDEDWMGGGSDENAGQDHDDCDPLSATRLAITRSAAAIWDAKQ